MAFLIWSACFGETRSFCLITTETFIWCFP